VTVLNSEYRQPHRDSRVTLREITEETLDAVLRLQVSEHQGKFVADNARSIAQAHFSPHAWFKAICADETPVGFVMLWDDPDKPEYYLWRLMIDERYQGNGFDRQAVDLLIAHVRSRPNASELLTSVVQADGGPQGFYERLGFELTGDYEESEAVMRLVL